jgi:hypothetical protein
MRNFLRKVFCEKAFRVCLQRESDLTKVIDDLIKEHNITINELTEQNEKYKDEVNFYKAKVRVLHKLLNKENPIQFDEIVRACKNKECRKCDECLFKKLEIVADLTKIQEYEDHIKKQKSLVRL